MMPNIEKLRRKYMDNPTEGMTSGDIRNMSEDELLDMDYFLKNDDLDDEYGEEGFYVFQFSFSLIVSLLFLTSCDLTYVRRTYVGFCDLKNRNFL